MPLTLPRPERTTLAIQRQPSTVPSASSPTSTSFPFQKRIVSAGHSAHARHSAYGHSPHPTPRTPQPGMSLVRRHARTWLRASFGARTGPFTGHAPPEPRAARLCFPPGWLSYSLNGIFLSLQDHTWYGCGWYIAGRGTYLRYVSLSRGGDCSFGLMRL
ncbi:uncharacterized protein BO72DRAFT_262107 [Aspergillus fijiensis CBS 313.89]|uniref:Uncharacterized protein n=1 Tax=Aspergillus fijiensis CBS 313.89 TaxID=1448319 RepID=A0A8G1RXV1_9EURO|nr:uncharacterized protein BO72DRAFT_262107 [Aspergillus fijiensis CBS 313.89]RAK80864.1 hypothetical protein BO72DRAFT_262107 [Aspergillus fijiensis CBS 313.89]